MARTTNSKEGACDISWENTALGARASCHHQGRRWSISINLVIYFNNLRHKRHCALQQWSNLKRERDRI